MNDIEEVWGAVADTEPVVSPERVFQLLCGRFPGTYGRNASLKGLSFVGSTLNSHAKRPEPSRWHRVSRARYKFGAGPTAAQAGRASLGGDDDEEVEYPDEADEEGEPAGADPSQGGAARGVAGAGARGGAAQQPQPDPLDANGPPAGMTFGCSRCRWSANGCGGPSGCRAKAAAALLPPPAPPPQQPQQPPAALLLPPPSQPDPATASPWLPAPSAAAKRGAERPGDDAAAAKKQRPVAGQAADASPEAVQLRKLEAKLGERGLPMEQGWACEVRPRPAGGAGPKQDVEYIGPDGRRFRSILEVLRHVAGDEEAEKPAAIPKPPAPKGILRMPSAAPAPAASAAAHAQAPARAPKPAAAVQPPAPGIGPSNAAPAPALAQAASGNAAPGPRDGSADQRLDAFRRELSEHKAVQELLAHLGTLLTDHERSLHSIADERDQSQLFNGARNPLHRAVIPRPDRFLLKPQFGAGAAQGAESGMQGRLEQALREMMHADPRAREEGGRARLRDVDVAWLRHEEGTFKPRVLLEVEHSTLKSGSGLLRLLDVCAHYKQVFCIFVVKEEDEQRVRTLLRPDGAWRKVLHLMDSQETAKFAVIWQPDLVHGYSKVASGAPGHLSMSVTQCVAAAFAHKP